jgi:soluble lytic murein transglycosylase-like protein
MAMRVNFFLSAASLFFLLMPGRALADPDLELLRGIIVAQNEELHRQSLTDGSYRGEEGILRVRPDTARSLGLKVPDYEDYRSAATLFEESEVFFKRAQLALAAETPEASPNEHAREALKNAVQANARRKAGWSHLMSYRSSLRAQEDERFDPAFCSRLMEKLILEALEARVFNLREGLAVFFNRCQGQPEKAHPLNGSNVKFVNAVFKRFTAGASQSFLERLDLDRVDDRMRPPPAAAWKCALDGALNEYMASLEEIVTEEYNQVFPVDPLLFFALMRRESAFDARAVSSVGAAGLTQLMPGTAKDMGMAQVYLPAYLEEARQQLVLERRLKQQGKDILREIRDETALSQAKTARDLVQKSLWHGRKKTALYGRYRDELRERGNDDRFHAKKAMALGLKYFTSMLRMHHGDMSLALAGYNAGPHRVREYEGIPPYAETITFRNVVLGFYREYLQKLNHPPCPEFSSQQ